MIARIVRDQIGRAWRFNRPLTLVGLSMIGLFAATLVGLIVDPRVITGAPAWLKPMKFAISVAIYSFSFLWLLTFIENRPRLVRLAANGTALAFVIEIVIIVLQAARGTTSHFNMATTLDAALFSTMGGVIVGLWLLSVLAAVLLLRQRFDDPAFAWALRLGLLVSIVGMAVAFLMTTPTAEQLTAARRGMGLAISGAHTVGAADGGPGLPIVGWSTIGGDLRVAHFIGLHALQILPLIGWLLNRGRARRLPVADRLALVWSGGLGYLAIVALLTWQALRGQSVIAPDALTIGAFAAIVAIVGVAGATVLVRTSGRLRGEARQIA